MIFHLKFILKNLKRKISGWAEKEKAFFEEHQDKPKSKERRSWSEALKDKVKGARNAIVHGFKHIFSVFHQVFPTLCSEQ